jgi:hypothetical protein
VARLVEVLLKGRRVRRMPSLQDSDTTTVLTSGWRGRFLPTRASWRCCVDVEGGGEVGEGVGAKEAQHQVSMGSKGTRHTCR